LMFIDQDIVQRHSNHHASVLQPVYKCLSPNGIIV
jgi:hypothetical protein